MSHESTAVQSDRGSGEMLVGSMANDVCGEIPQGYEMQLCMENGAAWVTLLDMGGSKVELPDSSDKRLEEQIRDALEAARTHCLREYGIDRPE